MKNYTTEQKQQILDEVKEIGNVTFVAKKNNIPASTIHTWLKRQKNKNVDNFSSVEKIKQLKQELSDKELEINILRDLLKKTYQIWPKN